MATVHKTARDMVDGVGSKQEFVAFIREMNDDLRRCPDQWENPTLDRYLEAMAAWVEDMDGYYLNRGEAVPQQPTWKVLADILMAAKMYE